MKVLRSFLYIEPEPDGIEIAHRALFEMEKFNYKSFLPHIHPPGETLFVTFRLADTLPKEVVLKLKDEHEAELLRLRKEYSQEQFPLAIGQQRNRLFGQIDKLLDAAAFGPTWLQTPVIANEVVSALKFRDGKEYDLLAYCLMPNHVHVVLSILTESTPFYKIMQSVKSFSARKINQHLNRDGQVWQREYFDRVIRNGNELSRTISYVLENPVKAKLCATWQQWPFNYWKES